MTAAKARDLDRRAAPWRRAYRETAGGGEPLTDQELVELVTGAVDDATRARMVDRIVSDPESAERYRLLQDLHREASASEDTPRRRIMPRWALGLAAGLVIAFGGLGVWQLRDQPISVTRSAADREASPAQGAVLGAAPESLEWPAPAGARSFELHLMDATAETVWRRAGLDQPRCELPSEVREHLDEGGDYLWTVAVDGRTQRRELGPYWFTVRPGPDPDAD